MSVGTTAAGKTAEKVEQKIFGKIGTILDGNKAINTIYDFVAGTETSGFRGVANAMKKGGVAEGNLGEAIKTAYKSADGKGLNYGAIAGSYIGASAGYRVLSGGGVYRDKNGNTNLIGVPFV